MRHDRETIAAILVVLWIAGVVLYGLQCVGGTG